MKFIKKLLLATLTVAIFVSCNESVEENPKKDLVFSETEEGINEKKMVYEIFENFTLVEDDILVPKKAENVAKRHYCHQQAVSIDKIIDVKLRISLSIPQGEWRKAIKEAANSWTKTMNSRVKFRIVESAPYDVLISSDYGRLKSNVAATTYLPQNCMPSKNVMINLDFSHYSRYVNRVYNIAHELGHVIGLRHTNAKELGEYNSHLQYTLQ